MKIKLLLVAGCVSLLLSACSRVYSPALYHNDIAYMPKPTSFDQKAMATYISGGLDMHSNDGFSDLAISGQVNLSQGHRFNNFNVAYGGFASFGDYQNGSGDRNQPDYFKSKFFGAVGGRFSANAFVNQDRVDFRFIGVEAVYSHEFGDYQAFRKTVANNPDYKVDARTDLLSLGLTTEVIFHTQNNVNFQHGVRGYLGTTFGYNPINEKYYDEDTATRRMFRNIYPKASYFMRVNDFFGTLEVGSAFMIRAGYRF